MLYQLPLHLSLALIFVDLGLIAWVIFSNKWYKWRTFSRIGTLVLFFGFSLLKLIATSPSFASSSPNDLTFKSSEEIGKLFLARQSDQGLFIFWEEMINGTEGSLTVEMEGIYPNHLVIIKEIQGMPAELKPNLEISGNTWHPLTIQVNDSKFQPISKEGQMALNNYHIVAWANYASYLLSFAFLSAFVITALKKPRKKTLNY